MTEITTSDVLSHYGVKGMKWGVRNDKGHEGEEIRTYKFAELDKQYADRSQMSRTKFNLHNEAVRKTNAVDIARINNKPEYKNADFTQDSPLRRQYYAEHQKAFVKNLRSSAADVGTNASGTKQYQIKTKPNGSWSIKLAAVKHADDEDTDSFDVDVNYNATGHILSLELPKELEQSDMDEITTEDVLAHYGVKGMKWGKRSASSSVDKSAAKERRVERRAEIRSDTKDAFRAGAHGQKTKVGLAVASTLVIGPPGALAVGGAQMMRSAGYSRGKSAAASIMLGPVGALALTELAVRKQTRED